MLRPGPYRRRAVSRLVSVASVLATLLGVVSSTTAEEAAEWEAVMSREGIDVAKRRVAGRAFPILRAIGTIDANLYEVLAVIHDVGSHPTWMHNCKEARRLRSEGKAVAYVYNRTGAPWPVADRDVVVRSETLVLEPGRAVRVRFGSVDEALPAEPRGVVRVRRLEGHYDLRAESEQRTRVEYRVDLDPGGRLPAWIVNLSTRDLPFWTLANLRQRVGETRGEHEAFLDEWDPARAADPRGDPLPP